MVRLIICILCLFSTLSAQKIDITKQIKGSLPVANGGLARTTACPEGESLVIASGVWGCANFSLVGHAHSGVDITSGIVGRSFLPSEIAYQDGINSFTQIQQFLDTVAFTVLSTNTADIAGTGEINFSNGGKIAWRNAANTGDLKLGPTAADFLEYTSPDTFAALRLTASGATTPSVQFTGIEDTGATYFRVNIVDADAEEFEISPTGQLRLAVLAGASPTVSGTLHYDSTSNTLEYGENGTNRTVANLAGGQTLENKAISGAANTLSNISPAQMTADAREVTKSFSIFDPTTADTNKIQFDYNAAVTVVEVHCSTLPTSSTVTIQFDERVKTTPNTVGTDVMTSSLVCDDNDQSTATFTNAGIAADAPVNLQITAVSGAPTAVRIHVQATRD